MESDTVHVGDVISLWNLPGNPTVVSPSKEASVSVEEQEPEVKDEADQLHLQSLDISPNGEWNENDVEEPNEDPSARKTPPEEESIPDPIEQEIKKHINKQNRIPWQESKENNVHLHKPRNNLEKNSQPSRSSRVDNVVKLLLVNWVGTSQIKNSVAKVVNVTCGILARAGAHCLSHVVVLDAVRANGVVRERSLVENFFTGSGVVDVFIWALCHVHFKILSSEPSNAGGPFLFSWCCSLVNSHPHAKIIFWQVIEGLSVLLHPVQGGGCESRLVIQILVVELVGSVLWSLDQGKLDLRHVDVFQEAVTEVLWLDSASKLLCQLHV